VRDTTTRTGRCEPNGFRAHCRHGGRRDHERGGPVASRASTWARRSGLAEPMRRARKPPRWTGSSEHKPTEGVG